MSLVVCVGNGLQGAGSLPDGTVQIQLSPAVQRKLDKKLQQAIKAGDGSLARELIAQGANINRGITEDGLGETLLHKVAKQCAEQCCSGLVSTGTSEDRLAKFKLLLELGADVKACDFMGWTPLHTAAQEGLQVYCELLLEASADINAVDTTGGTPAAYVDKDNVELFTWLQAQGARVQKSALQKFLR